MALKRVISAPMLALYGMGNILGAGIYVLVGKVAGESGYAAPYAFLLAALVAGLTGVSYARLSSRFPKCAGEANYVLEAFHQQRLSFLIGIAIILSGLVSSSAILHGFAAYLQTFIAVPSTLAILTALVALTAVAIWGIKESMMVTVSMTVVEILGLMYLIFVGWPDVELAHSTVTRANEELTVLGFALFSGAFIAFYAYVGFEDIVNVAEEVVNPSRTMPIALGIAVIASTCIYALVAFVAIANVSPDRLQSSDAPLALIFEQVKGEEPYLISVIALFAVVNGALVNVIMCARVIYGMACNRMFPSVLAKVSSTTQTPINATLVAAAIILVMAMLLPLLSLAKVTSFILLTIFILVNASCFWIWYRDQNRWRTELIIPLLGVLSCAGLLLSSVV